MNTKVENELRVKFRQMSTEKLRVILCDVYVLGVTDQERKIVEEILFERGKSKEANDG